MKKPVYIAVLIILFVVSGAAFWASMGNQPVAVKTEFTAVSLKDNSVLLSDADVVSFNSTSQEFGITDAAVQRLAGVGDNLYIFNNTISLQVNGVEMYQGIFRTVVMSAVPELPQIAILYPSYDYVLNTENSHAIRLFYPSFEVPGALSETHAELIQHFQDAGKLIS